MPAEAGTVAKPRRRGRPRRPPGPETFKQLVDAELWRKHRVERNGKIARITLLEIALEHLVASYSNGNKRALKIIQSIDKDLKESAECQRVLLIISREAAAVC